MKKALMILSLLAASLSACYAGWQEETPEQRSPRPAVPARTSTAREHSQTPEPRHDPSPTAGPSDTPRAGLPEPVPAEPLPLGVIVRDVTYCATPAGEDLKMDIAYPALGKGPFPTVLYVHGGSWVAGNKSEGDYIPGRTELVKGGNIFVSIDYRLAPRYRFPAQIQDVQCAVRSLRANARALGIDPDRIAAMGSSAGGHLVSLLGTSDSRAGWEADGPYGGYSSRVNAVVDLFGPAVAEGSLSSGDLDLLRQVFGATSISDPVLRQYSPASHASPDDPPFLIIHGTLDATVPLKQSQRLAELLRENGVDATLIVVENAGHGLPAAGQATRPSLAEVMQSVRSFLDRTIGSEAS